MPKSGQPNGPVSQTQLFRGQETNPVEQRQKQLNKAKKIHSILLFQMYY